MVEIDMRLASVFKNGRNQAVRLPKEFEFDGVSEVEITREGDALVLRPAHKSWLSFADMEAADEEFLTERSDVVAEGLFLLGARPICWIPIFVPSSCARDRATSWRSCSNRWPSAIRLSFPRLRTLSCALGPLGKSHLQSTAL